MVGRGGRAGKLERQRLDGPPGGLGEVGKEAGKGFGVKGRKGRGGLLRGRNPALRHDSFKRLRVA